MNPTLVVLAAGTGSRYGGLKQLVGVGPGGETLIEYAAHDAARAGFGRIVLVVREAFAETVEQQLVPRLPDALDVRLALQPLAPRIPGLGVVPREKPWGTAHAVLAARSAIESPFAVVNADDWYGPQAYALMASFLRERVAPTRFAMVGFRLHRTLSPNGPVARGICRLDAEDRLCAVTERTRIAREDDAIVHRDGDGPVELAPDTLVSMNFWGFHPALLPRLHDRFVAHARDAENDPSAELFLPAVVDALLRDEAIEVEVLVSDERWQGVTYAADRERLREFLALRTREGLYPTPLHAAPS